MTGVLSGYFFASFDFSGFSAKFFFSSSFSLKSGKSSESFFENSVNFALSGNFSFRTKYRASTQDFLVSARRLDFLRLVFQKAKSPRPFRHSSLLCTPRKNAG